jgi:hypothetical protein
MRALVARQTRAEMINGFNTCIEMTLEVRSADGTAAEFYQADAERIGKALRFLSAPQLFTEPQFVLASEKWATVLATRT